MSASTRILTILFADIGGSTRLYEQVGDVEAHRRVAESLAFMERGITQFNGQLLRTVGDAALASFERCDDALRAACEMQLLHRQSPLSVRIGFHVGEVIPDKGDVYGNAVNVAARIASFARTDEITASEDSVRQLTSTHRDRATMLDKITVKGITEPVGIYRIDWQERGESTTIVNSPFAQREDDTSEVEWLELQYAAQRVILDRNTPGISMGRAEDCDLPVTSEQASRRHARIERVNNQYMLTDSSTNGTFLARTGQKPLFIRRESQALEGEGVIGLGSMPGDSGDSGVRFRLVGGPAV